MVLCRYSIRLVLLSAFLGSYIPLKCFGSERKCFIVEEKVLCYFSPNATSFLSWEEALLKCRENEATLPDLPNKVISGVLERYLESQKVEYRFWTSGRRIESQEWKWINGKSYNGTAIVKRHATDSQAVVRNDLTYLEQNPFYEKNYVCQHFGSQCQSIGAIALSDGCLVLVSKEPRNVSYARNDCLERGGDLAVVRTNEDLEKFKEVFWQLNKDHAQIWVGLRRHWWTWDRDSALVDVRFSSWDVREGSKLYNNCMVVDAISFKWKQVNCSDEERVLCQTVAPKKVAYENDDESASMGGLLAGILIGILIVAVAVVIAVFILRKRIRQSFDGFKRFRRTKSIESPMEIPHETEELSAPPSSDAKVTSSAVDQGHCTGLNQGHNPETSRGRYDKLNNRKSHNVEPRQRRKVELNQSRKSDPCQGYRYEPSQCQGDEQGRGRGVKSSQGDDVPKRRSHELGRGSKVEQCQGRGMEVPQGQMEDQFQDHYAKIGTAQTSYSNADDDEQPKTIVYAKLEFDAGTSEALGSSDQHSPAENQVNPTDGAVVPDSRSSKTSLRSSKGTDRLSIEAQEQIGVNVLQNCT